MYQFSNLKKRSFPLHHHPNKKEENLTYNSLLQHQCPEVGFSFGKLSLLPWINTKQIGFRKKLYCFLDFTKYRFLMEAFFHFFTREGGKIIEKTLVDL